MKKTALKGMLFKIFFFHGKTIIYGMFKCMTLTWIDFFKRHFLILKFGVLFSWAYDTFEASASNRNIVTCYTEWSCIYVLEKHYLIVGDKYEVIEIKWTCRSTNIFACINLTVTWPIVKFQESSITYFTVSKDKKNTALKYCET